MALASRVILGKSVFSGPQLASFANWGHPCTSLEGPRERTKGGNP